MQDFDILTQIYFRAINLKSARLIKAEKCKVHFFADANEMSADLLDQGYRLSYDAVPCVQLLHVVRKEV